MKDRPVGITLLALLAILSGIFALCAGLVAFGAFGVGVLGSLLGAGSGAGALINGIFGVAWGSVSILLGLGLWQMRSWARLGTIIVQAIVLLFGVFALIGPGSVPWINVIISVIIIWYLMRSRVQTAFA
jgi:uncharacterized membrane protein (DUF2068 family)